MSADRKVPALLVWRVAERTLGRMACVYMDPSRDGHNHADCLLDDESYAADLLLNLVAPAVNGDEDAVLDRMSDLLEAVVPDNVR